MMTLTRMTPLKIKPWTSLLFRRNGLINGSLLRIQIRRGFFLSAEFTPLPLIQKGENIAKPVDSKSSEEDKKQIGPKNK